MYRVYCDNHLLYHTSIENLRIFKPNVELEVNKTGSFVFTIYENHPHYDKIKKMKSIITVYQKDYVLFRGRVLDEEIGFYNDKTVTCEGDLAFLLDTVHRPENFSGNAKAYMQMLIDSHNAQADEQMRFALGNVTVDGTILDESSADYISTLEAMQKMLVDAFGGYLHVRHDGGIQYIDYLSDFTMLSPQSIRFGKNLLDMKRTRKGADIVTALIPLGAKIEGTEKRLTVESVNEGRDTITDDDAIAQFGYICKPHVFDKITDAQELLREGMAYLARIVNMPETVELTAADLATVDTDFDSFHIGTYVQIDSEPHGISQKLMVSKLSINLLSPAENKLTLGGVIEPFTAKTTKIIPVRDGRDGIDATVLRIDSSRGTVFKNSAVETVLSVTIYHGNNIITNKTDLANDFGAAAHLEWSWQRAEESTWGVISADDSRLRDDGFSLVLTSSDVDTKATFMCQLIL